MSLCESIESGPVDGDPNANTKKKENPFSCQKTDGIVKWMVMLGFHPLSEDLRTS